MTTRITVLLACPACSPDTAVIRGQVFPNGEVSLTQDCACELTTEQIEDLEDEARDDAADEARWRGR